MLKPSLRIFLPRAIIYSVMAVVLACAMNYYDRVGRGQRQRRQLPVPPLQEQESRETPELKAALKGNPKPIVVVLSEKNETLARLVAGYQKESEAFCQVVHVTGMDDEQVKGVFSVEKLPAAILYDANNREVRRIEGEVTPEAVKMMVDAAEKLSQGKVQNPES